MRVLGVDPGLTRCGVGVVDGVPGRTCTLVDFTVVRSDPAADLAARLLHLDRELAALLAEYQPDAVAVERVFSQHNLRTVMATAQAAAVAVLAAARAGLPVQTYTPSEVKAAVTGSGQADKAQVTAMVTRLLRLSANPRPADAADALALAICHVWRGGTQARLAAAVGATPKLQSAPRSEPGGAVSAAGGGGLWTEERSDEGRGRTKAPRSEPGGAVSAAGGGGLWTEERSDEGRGRTKAPREASQEVL